MLSMECEAPKIENVEQLENALSMPTQGVLDAMAALDGDIIVLGVGGKMGPSLARMAKRASDMAGTQRRVIGVSRFSSGNLESELQSSGIETIRCDLLDRKALNALPDAPNVIFMAGMKFGSTGNESTTWAMNSYLPGIVCEKYINSRIVAFSTGNIYGLSSVNYGGSVETDPPNPVGEYAMSALGRERIFEYFCRTHGTPMAIIRLNYATELRYGVLIDVARKVFNGETIDLSMGNVNVIWQGDANAMILSTFAHVSSPPFVINVAGPEMLSIRRVSEQMGEIMGKDANFSGTESPYGILSNGQMGHRLFGYPRVGVQHLIRSTADWVMRGGASLGKPTHFEARDGKF